MHVSGGFTICNTLNFNRKIIFLNWYFTLKCTAPGGMCFNEDPSTLKIKEDTTHFDYSVIGQIVANGFTIKRICIMSVVSII